MTMAGTTQATKESPSPVVAWASVLLRALARDEAAGRRTARVTEPNLATWTRFRGRLTTADFVALLFEDAAVLHGVPFDIDTIAAPFRLADLTPADADGLLAAITRERHDSPGTDYVAAQARSLGITARLARSDLHVLKPHHKVLELPGTGGQLAHHLASSQNDITLQANFTVACGTWQESTLAGVIALDRAAPHADFIVRATSAEITVPGHALRQRSFDLVVGVQPDKGGSLRVDEQLAVWWPSAKIVLV